MPPSTLVRKSGNLALYAELRRRVREALSRGRERAEDAVEREKVRTSWEVGRLIDEHVLLHKNRAKYGEQVLKRLSGDLGISDRELRYMVEFARTYPISPPAAKLSWGHYRDLLSINEEEQRKGLIGEASRKKWTRPTLRREIKRLKAAKQITVSTAPADEPLTPLKGKLDTYRIVTATVGPWQGKPAIDLGFSNYFPLPAGLGFREREIIHIPQDIARVVRTALVSIPLGEPLPRQGVSLRVLKDATPRDLFTYRAYLVDAVDADTSWMAISLGLGFVTTQKLRLRGIDAPEITTRAGREAKRFVEKVLRKARSITIATSKSDKYDRYLVDVFYEKNGKEIHLNQELLDKGLAVRVTE